jgi:hypothetical protein
VSEATHGLEEKRERAYMFFREVFPPRTEVEISLWHFPLTRGRPVARDRKLTHLELRVCDRAAGDARVRCPVEPAVEDVFAPAVHVILVDIVDTAVRDHDFVRSGCERGLLVCELSL